MHVQLTGLATLHWYVNRWDFELIEKENKKGLVCDRMLHRALFMLLTHWFHSFDTSSRADVNVTKNVKENGHDERWNHQPVICNRYNDHSCGKFQKELKNSNILVELWIRYWWGLGHHITRNTKINSPKCSPSLMVAITCQCYWCPSKIDLKFCPTDCCYRRTL